MRRDALPGVIITNRDLVLMNAVKIVFPESTNLLCWFHIDKNVKAKCKTLVAKKISSLNLVHFILNCLWVFWAQLFETC